jgi:hypothetical protein
VAECEWVRTMIVARRLKSGLELEARGGGVESVMGEEGAAAAVAGAVGAGFRIQKGRIWGAYASPEKKRRRSESENLCSGSRRVTDRIKGSSARVFNDDAGTVAANELGAMK